MAPTAENKEAAKRDSALVIGIGDYPRFGSDFGPDNLDGPVNDAKAITRWLVDEAGVPCEKVRCITSDGIGTCSVADGNFEEVFDTAQPRPEVADIERRFNDFVVQAVTMTGGPKWIGRRFWVYMAGHGFVPQGDTRDVCIFPADALSQVIIKNFCATKWIDWMATNHGFDEVVLWLDCCATIGTGVPPYGPPAQAIRNRDEPARRFIVTAAGFAKEAFEGPDRDGVVGGYFTRKLLETLRGGVELSDSGHITSTAIRNFFENASGDIHATVDGRDIVQRPNVLEADPMNIIHVAPGVAHPVYAIPVDAPAGTEVDVIDGALQPVGRHTVDDDGKIRVALAAGLYKIVGPGGMSVHFETVPSLIENAGMIA